MANAWINGLPGPRLADVIEKDGDRLKEQYHTDDPFFALWLHMVDRSVTRRVHMGIYDLEDWDYASAYEADSTPLQAALQMLEDNGWSGAFEEDE